MDKNENKIINKELDSNYSQQTLENIKHLDEYGNEFWYARELQKVLEYKEWRNFERVINKAMKACKLSNNDVCSNFVKTTKIGTKENISKKINDYILTRLACYLVIQNSNPKIKKVALAQTYFAIQTRKRQLNEEILDNMNEDELIANLFRISLTKQRLIKDNIQDKDKDNAKVVHHEVGKKVRKAIQDIGGTLPEESPTQEKRNINLLGND